MRGERGATVSPRFRGCPTAAVHISADPFASERGHGFQIVLQRLLYVALVVGLATAVVQNAAAQSASLVLSPTSLDVPEAASASYTVKRCFRHQVLVKRA